MDRTKAMFETLLEERLATSKRYLYGTYITCQKEFLKLYADLPADNVERIAAEALVRELKNSEYTHPIAYKHIDAQDAKRRNARDDEIKAKVAMEEPVIVMLIEEYNTLLKSARAIEGYSKVLKTAIMEERSPLKRRRLRHGICTAADCLLRKTHSDAHSNKYIVDIIKIIRTGSVQSIVI